MNIRFYNSASRQKEEPKPLQGEEFRIYSCGPTLYDVPHIGNWRSFIFADILVRFLRFVGYKVRWVMNLTDIDDKTIAAAKKANIPLGKFTQKFAKIFFEDLKKLDISRADVYPRATEHFAEMKALVKKLQERGFAYAKDGDIYFDISCFKNYGKFAGLDLKGLKPGARISTDEYTKDDVRDFVLWKSGDGAAPPRGLCPAGRPGWHLECSAMSAKYLGVPFDIHTGGVDLIFPHHQNEIAQTEAAFGKPLAKIFMHGEHLLVQGKKMAKSEGNYYTLEDLLKKGYSAPAIRYLLLSVHYRQKMNFTFEALDGAEKTVAKIRQLIQRGERGELKGREGVLAALSDDLDMPRALAILHQENSAALWREFDRILGLGLDRVHKKELTAAQKKLISEREIFRQKGEFQRADKIRQQLEKAGIFLEDTKKGTKPLTK